MLRFMKKLSTIVKCKECKEEVKGNIRDHWLERHLEKLSLVDRWLENGDNSKEVAKVAEEGMIGYWGGKEK